MHVQSSNTIKNIGIGVVTLLVVAGAYVFLVNDSTEDTQLLTVNSPAGIGADASFNTAGSRVGEAQEVVRILSELKLISIDANIFSDPTFITLTDFHREIPQEPFGRQDPFLPGEGVKSSVPGQAGR